MFDRIARWQPDRGAAATARAVGALALIALAVIHVVDLPGTLGPDRLVGIGYLGIIAAAVLVGGVMIAGSHWLAWAAAGAVAVSAMGGYMLTPALPAGRTLRPGGPPASPDTAQVPPGTSKEHCDAHVPAWPGRPGQRGPVAAVAAPGGCHGRPGGATGPAPRR